MNWEVDEHGTHRLISGNDNLGEITESYRKNGKFIVNVPFVPYEWANSLEEAKARVIELTVTEPINPGSTAE